MGEGGGGEEKGRPDTKPFSKSCDTSKIWMWQWLDNTQYSLTSPTASKYNNNNNQIRAEQSARRSHWNFSSMFWFHVVRLWTETQRGIQNSPRGRSKVLSWNKNKTEQELCFQSLVVKRNDVLGVWKSLIYQLLLKLRPSNGFTRPRQRRWYKCFRYLSSEWFTTSCRWKGIVTVNKIRAR